jgi:uncharacterized delta-60 repeat protein
MKNATMLVFAIGIAVGGIASAADGDVDLGFGVGGVGLTGITDAGGNPIGCKPVVQPDDKILVCGTRALNGSSGSDFLVARFTADGTLDSSFSFDGLVTVDFDNGVGSDLANGIALQADGKVVVVGTTSGATFDTSNFAVARLNSDGTLDTTFGAGTGKTTIEFDLNAGSGADVASGVAIQQDGKIVIVGSATTPTGSDVAVARLLPDGSRDSGFNLTGKVNFGFALPGAVNETDAATAVAIDRQGRIVIGATANETSPEVQSVFAAARLTANGQLDANFHSNGRSTVAFDPGTGVSSAQTTGIVIQRNDGAIVMTGSANSSASATPNSDIAVVRFLPDGSPDGNFGIGGKTLIAYDLEPSGLDLAVGIAQQSDGRLILVGTSLGTPIQYGTVTRLTHDGSLDPTFGAFGKKTYDFALTTPDGQAFIGAAFQDTQIIVSGIAYVPPGGGTDFIDNLVTRIENDTIFANGFE